MRVLLATFCLALVLAGCRGTGGGLLGQVTIPPPGTQPPGALLAGNSYYPGAASTTSSPAVASSISAAPASRDLASPSFTSSGNSQPVERRGASLSRASLGTTAPTAAATAREEAIRIPDDSASAGALAAVVPIRGIPMTDATRLFDTVRSQLASSPTSLAARSPTSSGFVEISQLPDAPAALRRAARSGQSLR